MKRKNFPGRKDQRRRDAIGRLEWHQGHVRFKQETKVIIENTRAKLKD